MKKHFLQLISLVAILFTFPVSSLQAQCELDTTILDTTGVFPQRLPDGEVGIPYNQTIHFVFPTTLSLFIPELSDSIDLKLCIYSLDSLPNLPEGLSMNCNTPDCVWEMDFSPDVVNRGCVQISGTPTSAVKPDDSLRIFLSITPSVLDTTDECTPLPLSQELIEQYATQQFLVPFTILGDTMVQDTTTTSRLSLLSESAYQIRVFPNPTSGSAHMEFFLPEKNRVGMEVLNQIGQKVWGMDPQLLLSGTHRIDLPAENWTQGMYFVRMVLPDRRGQFTQKLRIN
ncbi:MAG: T9SS type A sorting domain-containing protein [Bacteroidota bacterium]